MADVVRGYGFADSGDLESDLKDMPIALGKAARDTERLIAVLIDELQSSQARPPLPWSAACTRSPRRVYHS